MTKNGMKAVRWCCGYNPDLRKKLKLPIHEQTIYNFLRNNLYGIYGPFVFQRLGLVENPRPIPGQKDDWFKFIAWLESEAAKICRGEYDAERQELRPI